MTLLAGGGGVTVEAGEGSSFLREVLLLLTVLIIVPPFFVSRSQLREPLAGSELEILLASTSLLGDGDLWLGPTDQVRMSRNHLERLGRFPRRALRLEQPLYSLLAAPLALAMGESGFFLLNALMFAFLLWVASGILGFVRNRWFWWVLGYFLLSAYPILVWRLDSAIFAGVLIYFICGRWGGGAPFASGFVFGLLLVTRIWLLPLLGALAWVRGRRFAAGTALGAVFLALLLVLGGAWPSAPGDLSQGAVGEVSKIAKKLVEAPAVSTEPAKIRFDPPSVSQSLSPELRHSWLMESFFGRSRGLVPYFPLLFVGLFLYMGYAREWCGGPLAAGLLGSLACGLWLVSIPSTPPVNLALATLLPAFLQVTRPVRRFSTLALLWCAASVTTGALVLNPIYSASHPEQVLSGWPYRNLPLEFGAPHRDLFHWYSDSKSGIIVAGIGRHVFPSRGGALAIRGKQWAQLLVAVPESSAPPRIFMRAPVDLEMEIWAEGRGGRLHLAADKLYRFELPAEWFVRRAGLRQTELFVRTSAGLVPRLHAGRGAGIEYVGAEIWFSQGEEPPVSPRGLSGETGRTAPL